MVYKVTERNFEEEVLGSKVPVLVDFWAPWCGPCQMQGPVIEQAAEKFPEVKFAKLNVDEEGGIAQKYQVMSIPMLVLFKDGQAVKEAVGFHSLEGIQEIIA
ncbi:thioredoxin [Lachnospiraceae bacterium 29-84]